MIPQNVVSDQKQRCRIKGGQAPLSRPSAAAKWLSRACGLSPVTVAVPKATVRIGICFRLFTSFYSNLCGQVLSFTLRSRPHYTIHTPHYNMPMVLTRQGNTGCR